MPHDTFFWRLVSVAIAIHGRRRNAAIRNAKKAKETFYGPFSLIMHHRVLLTALCVALTAAAPSFVSESRYGKNDVRCQNIRGEELSAVAAMTYSQDETSMMPDPSLVAALVDAQEEAAATADTDIVDGYAKEAGDSVDESLFGRRRRRRRRRSSHSHHPHRHTPQQSMNLMSCQDDTCVAQKNACFTMACDENMAPRAGRPNFKYDRRPGETTASCEARQAPRCCGQHYACRTSCLRCRCAKCQRVSTSSGSWRWRPPSRGHTDGNGNPVCCNGQQRC